VQRLGVPVDEHELRALVGELVATARPNPFAAPVTTAT